MSKKWGIFWKVQIFPANRRQQLPGHKLTQKGGGAKASDLQKESMSAAQSKIQLSLFYKGQLRVSKNKGRT